MEGDEEVGWREMKRVITGRWRGGNLPIMDHPPGLQGTIPGFKFDLQCSVVQNVKDWYFRMRLPIEFSLEK